MYVGRTVFAQLMDFVPRHEFRQIVKRHRGERRVRRFTCWDQFLSMVFAQLTYRESLRDIETCLRSLGGKLYHTGMRWSASRSTLADANEHRPWEIYQELTLVLIARAQQLYRDEELLNDLAAAVYALDATIIELCLKLFPWAKAAHHQATVAGVKLHTLLDVQSNIPVFARVSAASVNERRILDEILLQPGAFYVLDRGYMDFARLRKIDSAGAFFVVRGKRDLRFLRVASHPVEKARGVRTDQTIRLVVPLSFQGYPDYLRRIKVFDTEKQQSFVFLTNNFLLDALTIAEVYRSRWKIELFFKWIKQHLRIKAFYGTSLNAVNTQVWIALAVFVLVAIVKKELKLDQSLYTILQILSITLFEKEPINTVLIDHQGLIGDPDDPNQLKLFDF
jgi:Domain of unknown function (DUF4372)/Transposase DDE domain